jgi:hypothetical protein
LLTSYTSKKESVYPGCNVFAAARASKSKGGAAEGAAGAATGECSRQRRRWRVSYPINPPSTSQRSISKKKKYGGGEEEGPLLSDKPRPAGRVGDSGGGRNLKKGDGVSALLSSLGRPTEGDGRCCGSGN